MVNGESKNRVTQRISQRAQRIFLCVPLRRPLRPLRLILLMRRRLVYLFVPIFAIGAVAITPAQSHSRKRTSKPSTQQQAPKGLAAKDCALLHSSAKHKSLGGNTCHKVPTEWTEKREFPDV